MGDKYTEEYIRSSISNLYELYEFGKDDEDLCFLFENWFEGLSEMIYEDLQEVINDYYWTWQDIAYLLNDCLQLQAEAPFYYRNSTLDYGEILNDEFDSLIERSIEILKEKGRIIDIEIKEEDIQYPEEDFDILEDFI